MSEMRAYAESHDQSIVGDKTIAFWLMDAEMYTGMGDDGTPGTVVVERGMAMHKIIRLLTLGLGGEGYLNFMGNEFGHPEWVDFPREGNKWSYAHCRRRFDLADSGLLRYRFLLKWDVAMHAMEESTGFASDEHLLVSSQHEEDKVIVFERANLLFVVNLHPCKDYADYKVGVREHGRYKICLDSDAYDFRGRGRTIHDWAYFSEPEGVPGGPGNFNDRCASITLKAVTFSTLSLLWNLAWFISLFATGRGPEMRSKGPKILTARIKKTTSAVELFTLLDAELDSPCFNALHTSAAFTRLAFLKKRQRLAKAEVRDPVLRRLAANLHRQLLQDKISPRAAANILWAVVQVHGDVAKHMAAEAALLTRCVQQKAGSMNAFDLSNCLWAVASLHRAEPEVLKAAPALAKSIPRRAAQFVPQALSNILWAAATLQESAPEVLAAVPAVAASIPRKVAEFNPQDLSNCLWAAATLQEAAPEVLAAVPACAERVPEQVEKMIPQHLSNCLWAAANLQESLPVVLTFVPSVADRIPNQVERMIPQALSNCLWAAAYLQEAAPAALTAVPAIVKCIPRRVDRMILQELSNCLWAAGNLQEVAPVVLTAVPAIAERLPQKVVESIGLGRGQHPGQKLHRRATRLPWQFTHRARWRT
ncbi:SBE1 [Symbiodinium natans]|uniref:SBE1 protein n=1 Tax=Symbiodinium natans TaxID=878477 RepID=A0A812UE60_9DINO|nr:SBE1 [Symbiodinium natans]